MAVPRKKTNKLENQGYHDSLVNLESSGRGTASSHTTQWTEAKDHHHVNSTSDKCHHNSHIVSHIKLSFI